MLKKYTHNSIETSSQYAFDSIVNMFRLQMLKN